MSGIHIVPDDMADSINLPAKEQEEVKKGGECDDVEKSEEKSDQENAETDLFNIEQVVKYSSDEETADENDTEANVEVTRMEVSNSEPSSDSNDTSHSEESDSDVESTKTGLDGDFDDDDAIDGDNDEPIKSKNEIIDFKVPSLPDDYTIDEQTNIQFVGTISGIVEKNVVIKAANSAEEKVLNEGTVLCFEDRTPLGLLYEVFGRLQSPVYSVKYNSQEEAEKFKEKKGSRVFYVVPTAGFLSTQQLKKFKGSDASNCNDEELPEDEQEFSDDEKEAAAKRKRKKKKRRGTATSDVAEGDPQEIESADESERPESKRPKQDRSKNVQYKPPPNVPISVKARLTSLPSKSKVSDQVSSPTQQDNQVNPMAMMQQFMSMMQQATSARTQPLCNNTTTQYPPHYQKQHPPANPQYNSQFNQHYNPQYTIQNMSQPNAHYPQQYTQQYPPAYNQPYMLPQQFSQNPCQPANSGVTFNQHAYAQQNPPQNNGASCSNSFFESSNNSPNLTGNPSTALLVAQLAAAISKNGQSSVSGVQPSEEQSLPHKETQNQNIDDDDDYDPTV